VSSTKRNKRKRNIDKDDDTPKAFARLMAFRDGKKLPKGLDDGVKVTKKQKRSKAESTVGVESELIESQPAAIELPTIKPGERMSDFAARVDAALPVGRLVKKGAKGVKDPLGLKAVRTKTEKKMHRIYAEWREQDRKIREKKQEALELAEEEDDMESLGVKWKVDMRATSMKGRRKGSGKKKVIGEAGDEDDEDPWEAVKRARNEGPRRLNDVAQAPPQFTKVPKEKFKVRGARVDVEDVPKASGSFRRREELGEIRKSVVEGYRQMMKQNRAM
jgi:hypothetical protein